MTKILINIICAIYWWNPVVYLLRKDINQSIEIRCDGVVVGGKNKISRSNYLAVMLEEFKDNSNTGEFVIQTKYEVPINEIEMDDKAYEVDSSNSYIIIHDGEYILHSVKGDVLIDKEVAETMIKEGFHVREEE